MGRPSQLLTLSTCRLVHIHTHTHTRMVRGDSVTSRCFTLWAKVVYFAIRVRRAQPSDEQRNGFGTISHTLPRHPTRQPKTVCICHRASARGIALARSNPLRESGSSSRRVWRILICYSKSNLYGGERMLTSGARSPKMYFNYMRKAKASFCVM